MNDDEVARGAALILAGFLTGSVTRSQATAWADRMIAALANPPTWLIDVSMSTSSMRPTDMLKLLLDASRGVDRDDYAPVALWNEAVQQGHASALAACENLASIHLPVGARKRALRLVRAHAAAEDERARRELKVAMVAFLSEYADKSRDRELIASIVND